MPHMGRTPSDSEDLLRLYKSRPMSPEERTSAALDAARLYVASLRRKLFFEGLVTDPESGLPKRFLDDLVLYENIDEFIRFIETQIDPNGHLKHARTLKRAPCRLAKQFSILFRATS
jgi:hypothetical protein